MTTTATLCDAVPAFDFEKTFGVDYLYFELVDMTDDRNDAETAEIVDMLQLKPGDRVLDAPCGHGRIANRLASRGMAVTGVDLSGVFLNLANVDAARMAADVDYHFGDLRRLPVDGTFDAALSWFTSFGYFDDADNKHVLAEYRSRLRPGGKLLIESLHRPFVQADLLESRSHVTRVSNDTMTDVMTFDHYAGRLMVERTIVRNGYTSTGNYFIRLPTTFELEMWLLEAGFSEVSCTGRAGQPLRDDSRRVVTIATV